MPVFQYSQLLYSLHRAFRTSSFSVWLHKGLLDMTQCCYMHAVYLLLRLSEIFKEHILFFQRSKAGRTGAVPDTSSVGHVLDPALMVLGTHANSPGMHSNTSGRAAYKNIGLLMLPLFCKHSLGYSHSSQAHKPNVPHLCPSSKIVWQLSYLHGEVVIFSHISPLPNRSA